MDIQPHPPQDQVDPAEALGVIPPRLPDIIAGLDFIANPPKEPPQLIAGILHQGCKLMLGGTSKSNKSWCLIDMALAVASGLPWWGHNTTMAPVLFVNFELHPWAIHSRLASMCHARPEFRDGLPRFHIWNLRGRNADMTLLRPMLEAQLEQHQFGLIIMDPAYKVLGDRDENANGEIAGLMNEFEALTQRTQAAVVIAHHFAKGDSTAKAAIDRMSGAGAWARDPDCLLILTPHEEPNAYAVSSILRNLPPLDDFVVSWEFPLFRLAPELNPDALRRPQAKNKVATDKEFMDQVLTNEPQSAAAIAAKAEAVGFSKRSSERYLARLKAAGVIKSRYGTYWL